ncbi:Crp/Fnr family transcriptional regulator [Propioniciclava coleopterorum]|uniref:Crp/Fnr family transcriptional regulator n=1 Tax=Propioniciclava coleopterorum TaxID=2714937 RepID=A0A6G7Y7S5_9ACTN|nr:Crp/Fnr family transcriptional regulator [Propioniciclava coleopterorum]QIK72944.1 Crp/Fnr family transcriptional regulator [Propioniciclava coleopterorum]
MATSNDAAGHACVRRVPAFAQLDPALQDALGALAMPRRLRRGTVLQRAGDPPAGLFVVHTGRLRVERIDTSGRRRLLRVAGPGDVVGEHAFFTGEAPDDHIEVLADAEMCAFDRAGLRRALTVHPELALGLLRVQSRRLADAERRLALATVDVAERLSAYLLDLPATPGPGGPWVEFPWAKRDVAAYLGTTPESLSRALARLERERLIAVSGARVTLLAPDRLDSGSPG